MRSSSVAASLISCYVLFIVLVRLEFGSSFKVSNYIQDFQSTDNPDTYLPTPKIIRRYGYPAEVHIVQSDDGYLLELHRIPHGKNNRNAPKKMPILLHHGILTTSHDWILNGPEKSLGYILADRGHDVWLGNARGNTYSRSHVSLNPKNDAFWNFSFHESGVMDLPAMIDYILEKTNNSKLIHIGHSMGTTIFYVMCSERPEYNEKIKLHIGLAPVALITHTRSFIRHLIPYAKQAQKLVDWYNGGAVLEHGLLMRMASKALCDREIFNTNICIKYIMDELFGTDPKEFNSTMLPVIISHIPAGTSMKTLVHYAQVFQADKLQHYDYGSAGNLKKYKQEKPPIYALHKVTAPAALFYGKNDILADIEDVQTLYQQLANPVGLFEVKFDLFNHFDFITSIDCNSLLNYPVLDMINKTEVPNLIEKMVQVALQERLINSNNVKYSPNSESTDDAQNVIPDEKMLYPSAKINELIRQYENHKDSFLRIAEKQHHIAITKKTEVPPPLLAIHLSRPPKRFRALDNDDAAVWNDKFGSLFNKLETALNKKNNYAI